MSKLTFDEMCKLQGCMPNMDLAELRGELPQRFPLVDKPTAGMVISLPGVLERAASQCKRSRDSKHLEFPLLELAKHINHLRTSDSNEQALERLEKFLRLWVE